MDFEDYDQKAMYRIEDKTGSILLIHYKGGLTKKMIEKNLIICFRYLLPIPIFLLDSQLALDNIFLYQPNIYLPSYADEICCMHVKGIFVVYSVF